jgi:predicted HicB family RNase H-like nuclease
MAKKVAGAKQMSMTEAPVRKRTGIAVRLDLAPEDHDRLTKLAKDQGLSLASYARMALFKQMKADEGGGK